MKDHELRELLGLENEYFGYSGVWVSSLGVIKKLFKRIESLEQALGLEYQTKDTTLPKHIKETKKAGKSG